MGHRQHTTQRPWQRMHLQEALAHLKTASLANPSCPRASRSVGRKLEEQLAVWAPMSVAAWRPMQGTTCGDLGGDGRGRRVPHSSAYSEADLIGRSSTRMRWRQPRQQQRPKTRCRPLPLQRRRRREGRDRWQRAAQVSLPAARTSARPQHCSRPLLR